MTASAVLEAPSTTAACAKTERPRWTCPALDRGQREQLVAAVRAFSDEAKTQRERHGITEQPETHKVSAFQILIGAAWRDDAERVWSEIGARYDWTATPENCNDIIADLNASTALLASTAPIIDKTEPLAVVEERRKRAEEENARREARAKEHQSIRDRLLAMRPPWATALIVAELIEDKSDAMSDYFGHATTRCVAIGWRRGDREDFKQLRAAAARFPETAHLAALGPKGEHREKYSGGAGYYLKEDWIHRSGWCVRAVRIDLLRYRCVDEIAIPESAATTSASNSADADAQAVAPNGAIMRHNTEKNGIELVFPAKPDAAVLDALKRNGWRWSRYSGCWYTRASAEAEAFARQLVGIQTAA